MSNADIARILGEIAILLDMDGVAFKPRAYEKASEAVAGMDEPLAELHRRAGVKAIEEIPGVGKSIAEKIVTLLESGKLPYYEELHAKVPVDLA